MTAADQRRYLDDAARQLAATLDRAQQTRDEVDAAVRAASDEAAATRAAARADADRILADAQARAREIVVEANDRGNALVTEAEDSLSELRIERDAIAGYFESLRGVLSQVENSPAD